MRIPWIATLDALIDELTSHLDKAAIDELNKSRELGVRRARGAFPQSPPPQLIDIEASPPDQLLELVQALIAVRKSLDLVALEKPFQNSDYRMRQSSLDEIEESWVRYPDLEGREGLARLIEKGGLFGPILGGHIANVIRGESSLKSGTQLTFEEGRTRRYAVKQVATIKHLFAVGRERAVDMYCSNAFANDPKDTARDRVLQWVKRDSKEAKRELEGGKLSARDTQHYRTILSGLYASLPHGILKGKTYPGDLDALRASLAVDEKKGGDTSS